MTRSLSEPQDITLMEEIAQTERKSGECVFSFLFPRSEGWDLRATGAEG